METPPSPAPGTFTEHCVEGVTVENIWLVYPQHRIADCAGISNSQQSYFYVLRRRRDVATKRLPTQRLALARIVTNHLHARANQGKESNLGFTMQNSQWVTNRLTA